MFIKDQGVNLAVTILNQGTGSSAATTGSVAAGFIRYYVSPDNVITDSDHQISTDSFSSLAAGCKIGRRQQYDIWLRCNVLPWGLR